MPFPTLAVKDKDNADQIINTLPPAGQAAMADSLPVVLASNHSVVAVSAATLPLPTGAATQATLAAIDGKLPAQVSGRVPVDGSAVTQPVSAAALPLPTGAATQATLAAIDGKTPALGQALMASSVPVALASDQSAIAVNPQAASATGTMSAGGAAVTLNVLGNGGAAIDLRGTFVGTVTFQGTIDGTNWIAIPATPFGSVQQVTPVTTATAAGAWQLQCSGCLQVRAIATAYTSGTITATLRAMAAPAWAYSAQVGTSLSTSVNAISAGTNLSNDVGVQYRANATGAATASAVMSPATPAAASLKAAAGRLIGVYFQNSAASLRSVKLFNALSVTMGTTAALFEIDIPAGAAVEFNFPGGLAFSTAIQWAVTGAKGLTDNTGALGANDVSGFIAWA